MSQSSLEFAQSYLIYLQGCGVLARDDNACHSQCRVQLGTHSLFLSSTISAMSMLFGLFSRKPRQSLEQAEPEPDIGQDTASLMDVTQDLPPPSPSPSLVSDSSALYSLIRSVPPQVFHAYSLDRLEPDIPAPLSPTTLTKVTSFFSTLAPPPKLHCVRCHKSYFEVENTDRSCLVHHDDDSAEVERISLSKAKDLGLASEYETLWGCCGRTVEGDGDMGPPDGWCYEGKHTVCRVFVDCLETRS